MIINEPLDVRFAKDFLQEDANSLGHFYGLKDLRVCWQPSQTGLSGTGEGRPSRLPQSQDSLDNPGENAGHVVRLVAVTLRTDLAPGAR